jgi:hypothetical protein
MPAAPDNACRQFDDGNFQGRSAQSPPCYEGRLFAGRRFEFGCGCYHNGDRKGQPIPIQNVGAGDIAFLTTLLPGKEQHERIVFGCFRVAKEPAIKDGSGYIVPSDGTMDVVLPDEVALQMNFWRYFQNKDGSRGWMSGLFRHLNGSNTENLLGDLVGLLGDHEQRDVLLGALDGQLQIRPVRRVPNESALRFGGGGFAGGESRAHRALKE